MRSRLFVVLVSALVAFGGASGGFDGGPSEGALVDGSMLKDGSSEATPELEIHHIDVGQADSTLLVTPANETILIDTGHWTRDGAEVIAYLERLNVDRIDHLIATHNHADHIGGHAAVIEHYEERKGGVGTVYDSGVPHTTRTYGEYVDAVEAYDVDPVILDEGDRLNLADDSVEMEVRNPPAGDTGDGLNHNSLAFSIEFGGFTYLTTGDAEEAAERRMHEEYGDELDADVYQAGHHGSYTSSTAQFVDAVAPAIVVISSASDSPFGHPHDEVLERFAATVPRTYWTGVHGNVTVVTDGAVIDVETDASFPPDAEAILEAKRNASAVPTSADSSTRLPA